MSALLITLALLAADDVAVAPRPFHEIRRDVDDLLRKEAAAKDGAEHAAAVRAMAALYGEVLRDPRLTKSPTLQQYKAKLWRRLVDVKQKLEQQQVQQERLRERTMPRDQLAALREAEAAAARDSQALADPLQLVGYSLGGPVRAFASGGGAFGGAPAADYGPDLVRLIEHTIAPDFWEVNGGPGSIFYYAPLHALVVSATDDVHGHVGGVLDGLRAAP
jgi:hypothetical protein